MFARVPDRRTEHAPACQIRLICGKNDASIAESVPSGAIGRPFTVCITLCQAGEQFHYDFSFLKLIMCRLDTFGFANRDAEWLDHRLVEPYLDVSVQEKAICLRNG